jgi:hypothetical protein
MIDGRLVFGGNKAFPDTFWTSRVGNLFFMMANRLAQDSASDVSGIAYFGALTDSDPFDKTLTSSTVDEIAWLVGEKFLAIGTEGGEYLVSGGNAALSNSNTSVRKQSSNGGKIVEVSDDGIFFINRTGDGLVYFKYSDENGGYTSYRLDFRNKDIIKYTGYDPLDVNHDNYNDVQAEQIFWNRSRQTLWIRTTRNKLIGMVVDVATNMYAFFKTEIGGDAKVLSACNILGNDGHEYSFMLTGRTGFGVALEFIGKDYNLESIYNNGNVADLYASLDCCKTGTAVGTSLTISQFASQTMRVINLEDGTNYGLLTANGSGVFTLPASPGANLLLAGYDYSCSYKSLPIAGGGQYGPSAPSIQKIDTLVLQLNNARGIKYSYDGTQYDTIPDLTRLTASKLFTGYTEELKLDSAPKESQQFFLKADSPACGLILNIGIKGTTYEG